MTAWEPAVGDWVQVVEGGPRRNKYGPVSLLGRVGYVTRVVPGGLYGWVCEFEGWSGVYLALHELGPASGEELAKAQLASLEGL